MWRFAVALELERALGGWVPAAAAVRQADPALPQATAIA